MELSQKLAQSIIDTQYEDMPDEVVQFTKLCVLDYVGSAIAGADKAPVQMISELAKEMGGKEQSTLLTGGKSSALYAAFVNAAAGHMVELDDIHKTSIIHAGTVVIPTALAIADWKKLSGKEVLVAVAVGYDVCYRIGEAVTPSHYYYWHNTATCGTFGTAAAAAKLLGLSQEQTEHALGNAGTQAAGLWEFIEDGAMTKQLHTAKAAMNGVMSALLAQKGLTGATQILEGRRGFFEAMSTEYQAEKVTEGLGEGFKIMENAFKIHASCRHTHPVMDLLVDLARERDLNSDDIASITLNTYQTAVDITDEPSPKTIYAAKFSIQFCAALAIVKGSGDLDDFNEDTLWDDTIRSLMARVHVQVDPEINGAYPEKWGAETVIAWKDGNIVKRRTESPKGDPENPVTEKELQNKFLTLTNSLPEGIRTSAAERIFEMEEWEDMDILQQLAKDQSS